MKSNAVIVSLRALVYALCSAVFIWPLASLSTAIAGGVGAGAGVLLGFRLADSRLRSLFILLGSLLAAGALELSIGALGRSGTLAEALSPASFFALVDAL